MKKHLFLFVLLGLTLTLAAQTSNDQKERKIFIDINSKLGTASLKEDGNVTLHGNYTGFDILLAYKITNKWSVGTGVGFYELNGNRTIAGNSTSLKNSYLHIPLQFNGCLSLFKNKAPENQTVFLTLGLGLYANNLLKSEIETISGNANTKNIGWNLGMSSQAGVKFIVSDGLDIGLGLASQSDITKIKKDSVGQNIKQSNMVYLSLLLKY